MENKKQLTIENLKRAKAIMSRTDMIPRNTDKLNVINNNGLNMSQHTLPQSTPNPTPQKNKITESASKLPKEILESFMSKPLKEADRDVSFLTEGMLQMQESPSAVGGDFNDVEYGEKPMPDMNELIKSRMQQRQHNSTPAMNAHVSNPPAQQTNTPPLIDYSLIKMIIKEVVKEEFDNLIKNEGVSILKLDKKLNVITNSGNVFSGVLKKTGNIKKGS